MYAGPIADGAAALASLLLIGLEFRNMGDGEALEVSFKSE